METTLVIVVDLVVAQDHTEETHQERQHRQATAVEQAMATLEVLEELALLTTLEQVVVQALQEALLSLQQGDLV
jgi:hypothetical protein